MIYINKEKKIKLHNSNIPIPDGWKQITLDEWEELKKSWINKKNTPSNKSLIVEKEKILNWFNKTDYIELQAIRGTISRDSEKYINYLNEYNTKLLRYQEIIRELNSNE